MGKRLQVLTTIALVLLAANAAILNVRMENRVVEGRGHHANLHGLTMRMYNNDVYLSELIDQRIKGHENTIPNVVKKANPSIVVVEYPYRRYTRLGELEIRWGGGTGFFYGKKGHILSAAHVLEDIVNLDPSLPSPRVRTYDGKVWPIERVVLAEDWISNDFSSTDIGMVKISSEADYPPLILGRMNNLRCGQTMVVMGHPYFERYCVSVGVLSRIGTSRGLGSPVLLQIDAGINAGNSGGPVLGIDGLIYGICSYVHKKRCVDHGLNYFVAPHTIRKWAPRLIKELEGSDQEK